MGKFFGFDIYNVEKYIETRKGTIKDKRNALFTHYTELNGIVNFAEFSRRFMARSRSWFIQRVNGSLVMNKKASFKECEYRKIADGFRELAQQLNQYADEIDRAEMD